MIEMLDMMQIIWVPGGKNNTKFSATCQLWDYSVQTGFQFLLPCHSLKLHAWSWIHISAFFLYIIKDWEDKED